MSSTSGPSSAGARPAGARPAARPWSLRRRLGLLAGGGAAALALGSGLLADLVLESRLRRDFDEDLAEKARVIATLTEQEGPDLEFEALGSALPEFQRTHRPEYYEIWGQDGATWERSPSLGDEHLRRRAVTGKGPWYFNRRLMDGREGRIIQLEFEPRYVVRDAAGEERNVDAASLPPGSPRSTMTLALARDLSDLRGAIGRVRAVLGGAAIAFVAGLIVLVRWAISSTLAPLQRLADRVAALDPDSLGERLGAAGLPTEVTPLAGRLDDLLERLKAAFERERLFSSNVAHELRTPVAELRNLAEVAARWPGDKEAIRAFFGDVEHVAGQMEGLIANLLALARTEAGAETLQPEEAVLEDLTRAVWERLRARAAERGLSLDLQARGSGILVTDVGMLRLILHNLLGNAIDYAPRGSAVACALSVEEPGFRLSVSNPAPALEPEDVGRLFDRFWRKDEARGGGQHAGLGLTLVRSLCATLGYRVEPSLGPDHTLAIHVSGPRVVSA
jgi:signal transduction histidine kinase